MKMRIFAARFSPAVACVVGLTAAAAPLTAQESFPCGPFGDAPIPHAGAAQELARMSELRAAEAPPRLLMRPSDFVARPACSPVGGFVPLIGPLELAILPAATTTALNTGYPIDRNNGLLWAGRGVGSSLTAGVALRAGPLSAGLMPTVAWQQNGEYDVVPRTAPGFSPHINPFYTEIDLPQRFGDESFGRADLGQSFVRLDAWGVALGLSHENLWMGPAARNPILMSNTAGGFTHAFLGTAVPLDVWIGNLSAYLVLGRVRESDWFDANPDNDRNNIAIWLIGFQPRGLEGLELGGARVYLYRPEDGSGLGAWNPDLLVPGFGENLEGNELASLFARWRLRESGAEVYAEWGRDDRWARSVTIDLIPEPDHSQAYMIGFQKLTDIRGERAIRVQAELTHLQEKQEFRTGRGPTVYYTHHRIRQGHTHGGQLLGAGIGPGADAQFVGVDLVDGWGFGGVFVERVRRNDGSRAAIDARYAAPYEHDTEITFGGRGLRLLGALSVGGQAGYSHRWDRDFLQDDRNVFLSIEGTWWPSLGDR